MSLDKLVALAHDPPKTGWREASAEAFDALFGTPDGRYPAAAKSSVKLRAPEMAPNSGVPFAAFIHPNNPDSGMYGGMSFVLFPRSDGPCLISLVIGTDGLHPDDEILSRPGHARKARAITAWLNAEHGSGEMQAWAKYDPVRTDESVPKEIASRFAAYNNVFQRYGNVLYAIYTPTDDMNATRKAVAAFLDLMFEERGHLPLSAHQGDANAIRRQWFEHLMPDLTRERVVSLLRQRRFVIIQGPPGTGKTRMAMELAENEYGGNAEMVQFHPSTTYEDFVGGLSPSASPGALGFSFEPTAGILMRAAAAAREQPDRRFLLHIDEINRADLAKVLGEAIVLFEPRDADRSVRLLHDFGPTHGNTLTLPQNVDVIGTMNTADRSLALLDIAIRRRFAFVDLWPQIEVVASRGIPLATEMFDALLSIFVDHASDEAFNLMPGHAYFLYDSEDEVALGLKVTLAPLLEDYLAQGLVDGFAEPVRAYLQRIHAL